LLPPTSATNHAHKSRNIPSLSGSFGSRLLSSTALAVIDLLVILYPRFDCDMFHGHLVALHSRRSAGLAFRAGLTRFFPCVGHILSYQLRAYWHIATRWSEEHHRLILSVLMYNIRRCRCGVAYTLHEAKKLRLFMETGEHGCKDLRRSHSLQYELNIQTNIVYYA
jgi:hypothetical protein